MRIIQRLSQSFTSYGAKILHTMTLVAENTQAVWVPTIRLSVGSSVSRILLSWMTFPVNLISGLELDHSWESAETRSRTSYRTLWLGVGAPRPHMDHHPIRRRGRNVHECSTRAVDGSNASNAKLAYIHTFYKRSDLKTFKILHQS